MISELQVRAFKDSNDDCIGDFPGLERSVSVKMILASLYF